MEVSQIILCSILCVSLMVALSDSAPLQHSLMKRHAFQQNTQEIVKSRRRRGINRNVRIRQMYICLALIRDITDHRNFNNDFLPSYCRPLYCAQLARTGVQTYPSFCTNNVSITVIEK
ncbi:uncharacterized protein LOC111132959 [Crassostrea virginica]